MYKKTLLLTYQYLHILFEAHEDSWENFVTQIIIISNSQKPWIIDRLITKQNLRKIDLYLSLI